MNNIIVEKSDDSSGTVHSEKVSVVIPSLDGSRKGNVAKLKAQLFRQTLRPYEIITVIRVSPNGRSRNEGVKKASGDYYVFIDDDVTLGNELVIENLIKPFIGRNDIGMTGPSQLIPDDSNKFQISAAKQIPRSLFPVQTEIVDSDMVSHMCLAMPAKLFKDVGWENPDIISGTDPDLRYRVRKAGYRVCVVPDCWAYHPMPETFRKLMKLAFVKGMNSALVRKKYPELVFELDSGFKKDFPDRQSFPIRILRMSLFIVKSILSLKLIFFCYLSSYSCGYLYGTFKK